ncbi:MAG: phosphotransferase [Prosthecobacter sp.]|nr:phosphotransferase [Prosthecobacter sp.]
MLPQPHLAALAAPFGLRASKLTFLRFSQNHVYQGRQPDGKLCILRISHGRHRSAAEVETELRWISQLADRGISVCASIPPVTGGACLALDLEGAQYIAACFEHAPGEAIGPQHLNPALYECLGRLLGRMHAESLPFRADDPTSTHPHWHQSRLLHQDLAALGTPLTNPFRQSVDALIQDLRAYPATPATYGLIHGDVSFGNCFLHEGTLWIFDFDNCEYGFFLQDIATVLYDSIYCKALNKFADTGLTARMVPLFQAFLAGYSQTGVLKEIDPVPLKKLFLLREAIIYGHYHRTLDVENLDDSFKAGLEVMRLNVESQTHQVDFDILLASADAALRYCS